MESNGVFVSAPDLEAEYIAALGEVAVWSALGSSGLFSPNQLANCATTGLGGLPTADDLREYCLKNKVKAAMAVAASLDESAAARIVSIDAVLTAISNP